MSAPLVLKDFNGVIEITQDAFQLKHQALATSKPIRKVESPGEQLSAIEALRRLKEIRGGMEATRKAVKRPVLDLGKRIDDAAYGYIQEVDKEYFRLQGLINHFQKKQLADKKAEEEKLVQQVKQASELEAEAGELRHKAVFEHDADSRLAMLQRATELESRAIDAKLTGELAIIPGNDKPKGLVVRQKINFQVVDPIVFCQAWPGYWKWHGDTETLKLDRMKILDELNREDCKGEFHKTVFPEELSQTEDRRLVQPAGLRVYEEVKSHLR